MALVVAGRPARLEGAAELTAGLDAALAHLRAGDLDHVADVRAFVVDFCERHGDALHRTNPAAHLTASGLVVDRAAGRFVVLHHRKLGRWLQPGGHADGDGDLARVALREAGEETGLAGLVVVGPAVDLDVHEVHPPGEAPHLHLDLRFVVEAPPGSAARAPAGNHESTAIRWASPADLDALDADPSLRRLVARACSTTD